MRADKDSINVDIDLHLDGTIGEITLNAEDFSRVALILANNAFDAIREKAKVICEKSLRQPPEVGDLNVSSNQPKLTVYTRNSNGSDTIGIKGNVPGIPDNMKDKTLQPFFKSKKRRVHGWGYQLPTLL